MGPLRRLSPLGVLAATSLFAGCDYFSNVVIPATDTLAPASIAAVYDVQKGEYVEMDFSPGMYFEVSDPTLTFMAVGATYDNGGAQGLTMNAVWIDYCWEGGANPTPHYWPLSELQSQQAGKVGDTVSNGLWSYYPVRFDQEPHGCSGGPGALAQVAFQWWVSSVDFHENETSNQGFMSYTPPPTLSLSGGGGF